jgi:hypothetical protein
MHFQAKSTLKNNLCRNIKRALTRFVAHKRIFKVKKILKKIKIKDC